MLPLLGLATIVVLLGAILSKRMSPLVALIIVPIAASLIGGFGFQTSKFVIDGIKSLAPVIGMFVFAILYFGVITDAGMLDPIIDRILRAVGTQAHADRDGHHLAGTADSPGRFRRGVFSRHDSRDAAALRSPENGPASARCGGFRDGRRHQFSAVDGADDPRVGVAASADFGLVQPADPRAGDRLGVRLQHGVLARAARGKAARPHGGERFRADAKDAS